MAAGEAVAPAAMMTDAMVDYSKSSTLRVQFPNRARFFNHGCDESRQTPIRIKRAAIFCLSPWRLGRPRRTLVPQRVQWVHTDPWLPKLRRQSLGGSRCGRSAVTANR